MIDFTEFLDRLKDLAKQLGKDIKKIFDTEIKGGDGISVNGGGDANLKDDIEIELEEISGESILANPTNENRIPESVKIGQGLNFSGNELNADLSESNLLFESGSGSNSIKSKNAENADGSNSLAIGRSSEARSTNSVAIGRDATASNMNSTALGRGSFTTRENEVSIGGGTTNRFLAKVQDAEDDNDAVNLKQLNKSISNIDSYKNWKAKIGSNTEEIEDGDTLEFDDEYFAFADGKVTSANNPEWAQRLKVKIVTMTRAEIENEDSIIVINKVQGKAILVERVVSDFTKFYGYAYPADNLAILNYDSLPLHANRNIQQIPLYDTNHVFWVYQPSYILVPDDDISLSIYQQGNPIVFPTGPHLPDDAGYLTIAIYYREIETPFIED